MDSRIGNLSRLFGSNGMPNTVPVSSWYRDHSRTNSFNFSGFSFARSRVSP